MVCVFVPKHNSDVQFMNVLILSNEPEMTLNDSCVNQTDLIADVLKSTTH